MAFRSSDISAALTPPEALRTLPAFRPGEPALQGAADLARRAEAARQYAASVEGWAGKAEWVAGQIETEARAETVLQLERLAITLLWTKRSAERGIAPLLARYLDLRDAVAAAPAAEQAAWSAFVEPAIASFQRLLGVAGSTSRKAFAALQRAAPQFYPRGIDDLDPERLRDERAVHVYQTIAETELGLPTERLVQGFGDDVFRVLAIKVPPGVGRPQRAYRAALDRVHAQVRQQAPEFAGRVAFEFLRGGDAT